MLKDYHVGTGYFEAARLCQVPGTQLPRLHGHSFRLQYCSEKYLLSAVKECCTEVDMSDLNERVHSPDNPSLLRWFKEQLGQSNVTRLQLDSGLRTGATYRADQHTIAEFFHSRFEAAHYLPHVPQGHKCGRLHGHGFEVTIHALPESIAEVQRLWPTLHEQLHNRLLNDIKGLSNPTSELLAHWIWHQFHQMGQGILEVTVFETRSTGSTYNGEHFYIWKEFSFDSATHMPNSNKVVGHTYYLRVGLTSALDELLGWVEDFGDVKQIFSPLISRLDHQPLNEIVGRGQLVDCLNWLESEALSSLPTLARMTLWQTPNEGIARHYSPKQWWIE